MLSRTALPGIGPPGARRVSGPASFRCAARPRHLPWSLVLGLGLALSLAGCASHSKLPADGRLPRAVVIEGDDGNAMTLLVRPVDRGRLTSAFGWRGGPTSGRPGRHDGLDFAAPPGTPVRAAGAGRVVQMGWQRGYGRILRIRHTSRYETVYAHLAAFAGYLRIGQLVRQSEVIAYVGSTGNATGPHVHYEICYRGRAIDLLSLPWAGAERIDVSSIDPLRLPTVEARRRAPPLSCR
jgi:murein DD-endopeptidase MepM/ murein hydrolase activator NlpD